MPGPSRSSIHGLRAPRVILLGAIASTIAMLLFPPFVTVVGVRHGLAWSGVAWPSGLDPVASDLGLGARIDWSTLLVRLAALWVIALVAWAMADGLGARRVR